MTGVVTFASLVPSTSSTSVSEASNALAMGGISHCVPSGSMWMVPNR